MALTKKILKWGAIVLVGGFVLLVIVRVFHFGNLEKTNEQVEKIHSTRLQLSDVMGENLPPDPGEAADDTIAGVDANENGIRDDVELAVFEKYPKSAKKRAVSLQYAMALQMMTTQEIFNTDTATAVIQQKSRAYECVGDNSEVRNFVDEKQLNTKERKEWDEEFYGKVGSYSELRENICDLDLSTL